MKERMEVCMEYKEEVFKKSANRKAAIVWLVVNVLLTISTIIELSIGLHTPRYIFIFFPKKVVDI